MCYVHSFQETYLQHMMRGMLKQLQLGQRNQDLLSFVDAAMKVEQRKLVMETHYSQDLSLLYILQEDYDRAKYYASNCLEVFMQVSARAQCRYKLTLEVVSCIKLYCRY